MASEKDDGGGGAYWCYQLTGTTGQLAAAFKYGYAVSIVHVIGLVVGLGVEFVAVLLALPAFESYFLQTRWPFWGPR